MKTKNNNFTKEKDSKKNIFRSSNGEHTFVTVNKKILSNLSLQAIGMLVYMLSKPDNWNFVAKNIKEDLNLSEHTYNKIIKELKTKGYLQITRQNNLIDGRWTARYIIHEIPIPPTPKKKKAGFVKDTDSI